MRTPDIGVAIIDFLTTMQSIDYKKFQRFAHVTDIIASNVLSNHHECEVLVIVFDL